ncbi:TadE/TadG family type IV pilus assembly protein [Thalassovita taeanensis]|uniref:Flp pilus assembly protein TadG n=1 Tax=Thalassovita taeanensis TaxID=657014 RepID=A0A1H9JU03_9RHOB|nr:TadE/TadG family type IV pilus assembly protein [Thalassovita taeanensis]SEQ90288.1 Flp pilus assembly protein TadG [Thalassovita taeanensis]
MRPLFSRLRRFFRTEQGNASIEFVLLFPIFFTLLASTFELSAITIRGSMLERAVDLAVRDIRLGTGSAPQHDAIKQAVCDRAPIIRDCTNNLRVEMFHADPVNWVEPSAQADCTDLSEEVQPVRRFENGLDNELMIIRVCAKIGTLFPTVGLGNVVQKDDNGQVALVAASAFVQEPR